MRHMQFLCLSSLCLLIPVPVTCILLIFLQMAFQFDVKFLIALHPQQPKQQCDDILH